MIKLVQERNKERDVGDKWSDLLSNTFSANLATKFGLHLFIRSSILQVFR
jgi:hypothetical protein